MRKLTLDDFEPFLVRENVSKRKVFGMESLLVNGHVFLTFAPTGIVLKMAEIDMAETLKIDGADFFQPPMRNAPKMKGWIEVPFEADADWLALAERAFSNVSQLPPKVKKKRRP